MTELRYTTVDRVLSKFHRDLRGTSINESDAIEWIGEALGFLKVQQIQEEAVAFLEVENHETTVPSYFNMVIQIARKKNWVKDEKCGVVPKKVLESIDSCVHKTACNCNNDYYDDKCKKKSVCDDYNVHVDEEYKQDKFNFNWSYKMWRNTEWYKKDFTPVKLSNHTFFNSLVCKESDKDLYHGCIDEYTIVGTFDKKLRFSFKDGLIALSYLRTAVDEKTGYPLIPDNESYMSAITYYLKWKIAEWYQWNGRDGFQQLPYDLERKWLKYVRQAKNYMKMPKSLDDYQSILEQTYSLPNLYKYKNFFGNKPSRVFPL